MSSFSLPLSCFSPFSPRVFQALGRRDEKPPTKPREAPCVQDERALVVAATISVSEAAPGAATRRGLRRRPDTTADATATAAAFPQVNSPSSLSPLAFLSLIRIQFMIFNW